MHDRQPLLGVILITAVAIGADTLSYGYVPPSLLLQSAVVAREEQKSETTTLLFVGDVMLGRRVETYIDEQGSGYPFQGTAHVINEADVSFANFEGSVPETHEKTEDLAYRFSVKSELLEGLSSIGFDVLSLANNHSFDFGRKGYEHTVARCIEYGLVCGGDPYNKDENQTVIVDTNAIRIGIIFLHTLFGDIDTDSVTKNVQQLASTTYYQIAYIHWGEEYQLTHSVSQEQLAHALIDAGVDLVVGHHPHVTQDIELYEDKLIFYSLGNFIFDQYFSDEVQQGLMVKVKLLEHMHEYELIPVSSKGLRSSPSILSGEEREEVFNRLLTPLSSSSTATIVPSSGIIRISSE